MAETSALITAHAHARKAAEETEAVNWTLAADEHQYAADDYSRASKTTSDSEALRILRLLEEQHVKLANIIKAQDVPEQPASPDVEPQADDTAVSKHDFAQPTNKPASPTVPQQATTKSRPTTSALAAARLGSSTRESSPSLARDIASRRGIPQPGRNPPSAAAQARARQLSPESHRRHRSHGGSTPKIPPSIMESQTLTPAQKAKRVEDDNTFDKFYSTLTTGAMSKLSSALAYAGLPLTADDVKPDQLQPQPHFQSKITKQTVPASNDPDVNKIFSKAALNAIEDDHRQRGHHGHAFGPAESFYVVQTGGGTYSYADITKPKPHPLTGIIDEDDEEAFVDAREAQTSSSSSSSLSPQKSRFPSSSSFHHGTRTRAGKTPEELSLENTTLKQTLSALATRLREFETHAQDASMAALTQSMASVVTTTATTSTPQSDPALLAKLRKVEKQLQEKESEAQKYATLAAKQEKTLKKYQNKWEEIKQSAKEKQRVKAEKGEKGGGEEGGELETVVEG